jgi:hypothetical protein
MPVNAFSAFSGGKPFSPINPNNFIPVTGGANNALTGSLAGLFAYYPGLQISFIAGFTLQIGANTININGLGAKAIKSHLNPANNIAAAYAVGAIVTLIYDGTQFLDISQ